MTLVLKFILYPLIVLVGALGLFAFKNARKTFAKYRNYKNIEHDSSWDGFIRTDFNKWPERKILVGCFLKFPFKFLALFIYIICVSVTIFLSVKFQSSQKKISKLIIKYLSIFFLSFVINIEDKNTIEQSSTPIIISNHVSWIDIIYLVTKLYPVSIVAKQAVSNALLVGQIAKNLQCIFIQRNNENARKNVLQQIQKRINDHQTGKQVNPLLIFPEGTTSNGKSILKFKKGAFTLLPNITIFSLIYHCQGFDMGMDEITPIEHFVISMSLSSNLKVKTQIFSPQSGENCKEYMRRCQEKMSEMTGFQIYEAGYQEKCSWGELREQKKE